MQYSFYNNLSTFNNLQRSKPLNILPLTPRIEYLNKAVSDKTLKNVKSVIIKEYIKKLLRLGIVNGTYDKFYPDTEAMDVDGEPPAKRRRK